MGMLGAVSEAVESAVFDKIEPEVLIMHGLEAENDASCSDGAVMISSQVDCPYQTIEECSSRNDRSDSSHNNDVIGIIGFPYTDSSPIPLSLWTSTDEFDEDDEAFRDHELSLKKYHKHLRNLLDARFSEKI